MTKLNHRMIKSIGRGTRVSGIVIIFLTIIALVNTRSSIVLYLAALSLAFGAITICRRVGVVVTDSSIIFRGVFYTDMWDRNDNLRVDCRVYRDWNIISTPYDQLPLTMLSIESDTQWRNYLYTVAFTRRTLAQRDSLRILVNDPRLGRIPRHKGTK